MNVFYGSQFDPSDDTWSAIKVYRDGNPIVLDDGFATQDEAEDCADLARGREVYDAALATILAASAVFREVQIAYRARKIGDAEYIAGRAIYLAASKEFDAADAAFDAVMGTL